MLIREWRLEFRYWRQIVYINIQTKAYPELIVNLNFKFYALPSGHNKFQEFVDNLKRQFDAGEKAETGYHNYEAEAGFASGNVINMDQKILGEYF